MYANNVNLDGHRACRSKEVKKPFDTAGELFSKAYMKARHAHGPLIIANGSELFLYRVPKIKAYEAINVGYRFSLDYIRELASKRKQRSNELRLSGSTLRVPASKDTR